MGGTIELIGMGLGAMGSTDFTKLLFLLSIAQRLEWRGQTQKDGGSNPTKVKFTTYERKTNRINILLIVHHLLVANRFGPTIVRTKRANSERRLDQPVNFWGPVLLGPLWLSFQCPECSLYTDCSLSFNKWGALLN